MPYYKAEDLKLLLRDAFMNGVNAGYGADHEASLIDQEEGAFKDYYEKYFERERQRRREKITKETL